jgi:hypothetical protein
MKLKVSIGPSFDKLTEINVNNEMTPFVFESQVFIGRIVVRIKPSNLSYIDDQDVLDYFNGKARLFSFQIEGIFKHPVNGDDLIFGVELEQRPSSYPNGLGILVKFAQMIDPGLDVKLYQDRPTSFSPMLCAMNIINIKQADTGKISDEGILMDPTPTSHHKLSISALGKHEYANGNLIQEQNLIYKKGKMITAPERKVIPIYQHTETIPESNRTTTLCL